MKYLSNSFCLKNYLSCFNSTIITEAKKTPSKKYQIQIEKVTPMHYESKVNVMPTEPISRKLRSSPVHETLSHAEQAIQRWKEKKLNESLSKLRA